jgi:hypothetical protein
MFDRSLWRAQVGRRLDMFVRNPAQAMSLSGTSSLLAYLSATTVRPFLDAYPRDPITAIQVLASMAHGDGANEIVRRAAVLRYQAARWFEQELQQNVQLRIDIEHLMVAIDTIQLVRQRLVGTRLSWFITTLNNELNFYPHTDFIQLRRRTLDSGQSFHDVFRGLRSRRGHYTHEDLILLYVGLNDSAASVRAEASRRLGEYAWELAEKLVSKLVQVAVADSDLETRNAAARALGALRDRIVSPQLLEMVSFYLSNPDRFVRSSAALLLAELGELAASPSLIQRLMTLLRDEDPYVREAAARALGRVGKTIAYKKAVEQALTQALQDVHMDVHEAAVDSLQLLRSGEAVPAQPPLRRDGAAVNGNNGAAEQWLDDLFLSSIETQP